MYKIMSKKQFIKFKMRKMNFVNQEMKFKILNMNGNIKMKYSIRIAKKSKNNLKNTLKKPLQDLEIVKKYASFVDKELLVQSTSFNIERQIKIKGILYFESNI